MNSSFIRRHGHLLACVAALTLVACNSSTTGGGGGSGGSKGSGGAMGTGGTTSTGSTTTTGGTTSTGGGTATGGRTSTGGQTSTSGATTSTGGTTTSTGGATGMGGMTNRDAGSGLNRDASPGMGGMTGTGGSTMSGGTTGTGTCPHAQMQGTDFCTIGDSWIQITGDQVTTLENHLVTAGVISSGQHFDRREVSGTPIDTITASYTKKPNNCKILVMDGGGIDLFGSNLAPQSSVDTVVSKFKTFLQTVRTLGYTQHIIYSLYPVIPTTPHLNGILIIA